MRSELLGALLGTALVTAAPAALQDLESIDERDGRAWNEGIPPSPEQAKENERISGELQGAWILVEYEAPWLDDHLRTERGVMVFGPGFFSLEMHVAYEQRDGSLDGAYFQSGSFRYRLDDRGDLVSKQIIGADFSPQHADIRFQAPGGVRTFEVSVEDDRLELKRDEDQLRYAFQRIYNGAPREYDIFGRPIPGEEGDPSGEGRERPGEDDLDGDGDEGEGGEPR